MDTLGLSLPVNTVLQFIQVGPFHTNTGCPIPNPNAQRNLANGNQDGAFPFSLSRQDRTSKCFANHKKPQKNLKYCSNLFVTLLLRVSSKILLKDMQFHRIRYFG